jgi:hypothetical protein
VPVAAPILGLILAYKARSQASARDGRSGSEDLARIAIIVGWVLLGTSVVPMCAFPLLCLAASWGFPFAARPLSCQEFFLGVDILWAVLYNAVVLPITVSAWPTPYLDTWSAPPAS